MTVELPELDLAAWEPTKDTIHMYSQILGKIRLGAMPHRNHWWNATLAISPRGLATRRMHLDGVDFDLELDLLGHAVTARCHTGATGSFELRDGLSVAEFYRQLMALLDDLGVHPKIDARPFGVPNKIPFAEDGEHASYDAAAVERFFAALRWISLIFEEFAGSFTGKASPVHLFWHSFDLATARFSGRRAPERPGADHVTAEAYSHELISFGWWAGDQRTPFPAFYSYTAPEPDGLADHRLEPEGAKWQGEPGNHMAILTYDECRHSADPRRTLLEFLQSAYLAGATSAGWDIADLVASKGPGTG